MGEIENIPFKIVVYHSKKVNDLHRLPRVAYFVGQYFRKGDEAIRFPDRYEQWCNNSIGTMYYVGFSILNLYSSNDCLGRLFQ